MSEISRQLLVYNGELDSLNKLIEKLYDTKDLTRDKDERKELERRIRKREAELERLQQSRRNLEENLAGGT